MLDFKLCPFAIKTYCESIRNLPESLSAAQGMITEIIEGMDMWSFDKDTMKIETMLQVLLANNTSDRYHYNFYHSQYLVTLEILRREGYNEAVDDYYNLYDDSDEDFNRFWVSLQESHPTMDAKKINVESMRYFSMYLLLAEKLQEFAAIRGIDFTKCAEKAGWHKDHITNHRFTNNTTTSNPQIGDTPSENSKWQDYIIGTNKEAWERLITEELKNAGSRSGRLLAMIIFALQKDNAIKEIISKTKFYTLLRADFPRLSTDSSINKYLNAHSPNSYDSPIPDNEIEAMIKKVGCY